MVEGNLENTSATPGTTPENYFRFVPPRWNSTEIDYANPEQSRGIENRSRVTAEGVVEGRM